MAVNKGTIRRNRDTLGPFSVFDFGLAVLPSHWGTIVQHFPELLVRLRLASGLSDSPKTRDETANKEEAISLNKRWQEGKEAIGGHADQETLSAAHFVRHSSPKERSDHHSQVNNAAWKRRESVLIFLVKIQWITSHFYIPVMFYSYLPDQHFGI